MGIRAPKDLIMKYNNIQLQMRSITAKLSLRSQLEQYSAS